MPGLPQIIFFVLCAGISAYAATLFVNGMRSRSWPSVQGTITTSRVETALFSGSGGSSFKPILTLSYSYTVSGRPYSGKRIAIAPSGWFSMGTPAQLHAKYPQGAQVAVFYSPARPSLATLVTGVPGYLWSFYLIAGMFALLGLIFVVQLL
jgi:Protein of unknown function (DUF3592)